MAVVEYGLASIANCSFVHEPSNRKSWSNLPKQALLSIQKLEDEIRLLRKAMEQAYREQHSFTSDVVIEISRALDLKINEYMRITQHH